MSQIKTIFGKRGSGKTTLTLELLAATGGRVIFLSPVAQLPFQFTTDIWDYATLDERMETMRPGEILLVRIAEVDALDFVCAKAIYLNSGFTIVIDEVDLYGSSKEFLHAIHYSRHFNLNIISNTRRYADVPRLLTSQSDHLCFFRTFEPVDMEYLRKFCGKEIELKVGELEKYHYLAYSNNTGEYEILKTNEKYC